MIRYKLAENLAAYRKYMGYTQKDLAKKSGVTFAQIGNIENQRTSTGIDTVQKLADTLGIDPCMLIARPILQISGSGMKRVNIVPTFLEKGVAAYAFWTDFGMEFHPISNSSFKNSLAMMGLIQANGLTGKDLLSEAKKMHVPFKNKK